MSGRTAPKTRFTLRGLRMVPLAPGSTFGTRARRVELSPLEGALLRDMVSPGLEHYPWYCNKLPLWSMRLLRIVCFLRCVQIRRTATGQRNVQTVIRR